MKALVAIGYFQQGEGANMSIKDRYLPTCLRIGGSAPPGLAPILGLEDQERGHDEGHLVLVQSLHQVAVIQTRAVVSGYISNTPLICRYLDIFWLPGLAPAHLRPLELEAAEVDAKGRHPAQRTLTVGHILRRGSSLGGQHWTSDYSSFELCYFQLTK